MMKNWVAPETRDAVVDFVAHYSQRTGLPFTRVISWIGISRQRFYDWRERHGQGNCHNACVPRDFWLEAWERQAIVDFYVEHPQEGYRRLTYMMLDANIVAVSPSSAYRVLKQTGLLRAWNRKKSKKGTGFNQPSGPHHHWHVDVSYINICGTFYYFCGLLDGFSRFIVHWEIRESMKESDIEIIIQRAKEKFPDAAPRIISDNGPQFIARDFLEFIRLMGMTHVRTSPYYPQSNGKIERFHQSLKRECIRPKTPLSLAHAQKSVGEFVDHYNGERLHSAIGYITPKDKLAGRAERILSERKRKLHEALERRKARIEMWKPKAEPRKTNAAEPLVPAADGITLAPAASLV
jgi:putative transposase